MLQKEIKNMKTKWVLWDPRTWGFFNLQFLHNGE
jgi:hypothetical protein